MLISAAKPRATGMDVPWKVKFLREGVGPFAAQRGSTDYIFSKLQTESGSSGNRKSLRPNTKVSSCTK